MLDSTLSILLATLVVQGLKQIGLEVKDNTAKVIGLAIAALFLFGNGLIDLFVPVAYKPIVQQVVDLVRSVLTIFAPAGAYGYAKLIAK